MKKMIKIKNSVFLIIIVLFLILAFFLYAKSNKTISIEVLSYNEKSDINYEVCLQENLFYEEKCQPKDMGYIASAIDYINITFNYSFEANTKINYIYEYYIDGIITVYDRNNSGEVLFTKTTKIIEPKQLTQNGSKKIAINENLKIDYNKYNNLIKSFKNEYNILADSNLKLKLYIKKILNYNKFETPISNDSNMELTIPLTESTIKVNLDYKEINKSDKIIKSANKNIKNTIYFIFSVIFAVLAFILGIVFWKNIRKKEKERTQYEKFISNKIKNLDRMIISAKENVKIQEEDYVEIIDVENFTELVDIAERLVGMITWTEVVYSNEKVSWFTVSDDKRLYRIIYKSSDKEFK